MAEDQAAKKGEAAPPEKTPSAEPSGPSGLFSRKGLIVLISLMVAEGLILLGLFNFLSGKTTQQEVKKPDEFVSLYSFPEPFDVFLPGADATQPSTKVSFMLHLGMHPDMKDQLTTLFSSTDKPVVKHLQIDVEKLIRDKSKKVDYFSSPIVEDQLAQDIRVMINDRLRSETQNETDAKMDPIVSVRFEKFYIGSGS